MLVWSGRAAGVELTQKIKDSENIRLAMLPAVSAVSMAATVMSVNVEANMRNAQSSRNISPPRSVTAFVGIALRYRPMG